MNHDQIVAEIQARAKTRGILTHYCGSGERCHGDRGMPDLFLAGSYGAAWIEVKTPGDEMRPAQTTWKYMLKAAGQRHYVVGPAELADDGLDEILDIIADREAE